MKDLNKKIRKIVEKHVLPQVKSKSAKDKKFEEPMTKYLAYSLGLEEIVDSYVKDFTKLFKQQVIELVGEDAEKASVLNGKLRISYDKNSTLYNEYSTKLAYNQAKQEIREKI